MFITFEGGDGTGKSTQVKLLAERLRATGKDVLTTREPGGTPEAEALRNLLVSGDTTRWTPDEELLLNFAARSSHLRNVVIPALNSAKTVLCDRFVDSSFVYQCVAGGASAKLFSELERTIVGKRVPNFTFILDVDPSLAMLRANTRNADQNQKNRADRYERKGTEFHKKVRDGFFELAQKHEKRCHLIDSRGTSDEVAEKIWAKLNG